MSKFEPDHYEVNEAWVVFLLSDVPVMTEADGDFHVLGLIDAASCYMLGNEFVSVTTPEISQFQVKHLMKNAYSQSKQWPKQLIIHNNVQAGSFIQEAESLGTEVVHATNDDIWSIIREVVEGFRQHLGG